MFLNEGNIFLGLPVLWLSISLTGGGNMKRLQRILFIFLALSLMDLGNIAGSETAATAYRIDPKQSRFMIEAGTAGVFGFMGHPHHIAVRDFSGEIQASTETSETASVSIRVFSESLIETGDFSEKDLDKINSDMKQHVLETAKYPEILFKSTHVTVAPSKNEKYQVQVKGDLTLHGVTRQIEFPVAVTLSGNTLRANGNFKVLRKDYNVETTSAGGGTVKVGQELKVSFNIV